MPASKLSVSATDPAADFSWQALGLVGFAFTLIGALNLGSLLVPFRLGHPEWEFGTVSSFLDTLPLLAIGLAALLSAGVARGSRWLVRTIAVQFILISLIIWAAAAFYATNVPLAMHAVRDPRMLLGIKKAIGKTSVQALIYPLGFIWIAINGLRAAAGAKLGAE